MNIDRVLLETALQLPIEHFERTRILTDIKDRPATRPVFLSGQGRIGAVLILIYENKKFVLTKRHNKLKHHPGQISLPGGRQDSGETIEATAIRETEEEIGISGSQLQMVGTLNQVYIPPSDFTIFPFVALLNGPAEFDKAENEVDEIIEADISNLLKPESLLKGRVEVADGSVDAQYYDVAGHKVWGATAIVLSEFLDRLRAASS